MEMAQNHIDSSGLYKNFVSRCLESEASVLQGLLKMMEESKHPESVHIKGSLKVSILNLRDLANDLSL